jgi:hypothetical protein
VCVIVSPRAWDEQGQLRASTHQKYVDAGAKLIPLDIAACTTDSLKDQFKEFDTVINCMGFVAGAGTQIKLPAQYWKPELTATFHGSLVLTTMSSAKAAASRSGTNSMM